MNNIVNCFDVAKYILSKSGSMTTMKMHKLIYYAQAWSLAWDEGPLFSESIEAWMNGPVIPKLYHFHKGKYSLSETEISGDSNKLSTSQKETVDKILNYYGDKNSQWLSDLTHMEEPWLKAREGLSPNERGNREISHASMAEYYSSIMK